MIQFKQQYPKLYLTYLPQVCAGLCWPQTHRL